MIDLTKTPSKLIRLAIEDLIACEKSEDFTIDMEQWHAANKEERVCLICLAGAVMAQTLKCDNKENLEPTDEVFGKTNENALVALDEFRQGLVVGGLKKMNKGAPRFTAPNTFIENYDENPKTFKRDMLQLADYLEKNGL